MQPDVSDVGHPKLVYAGQLHPARQVETDLQLMIGIRGNHERFRLHRQQVVFAHQPRHPLVIHRHPAAPQFRADSPISVAPFVFDKDLLDRRPDLHVLFDRFLLLQRAIEARPAHTRQLTHSLDTQVALHRHQLPDPVVDAVSPGFVFLRRRAAIFCKAP